MMRRHLLSFVLCFFAGTPAYADNSTEGWTWGVGCPGVGNGFRNAPFSSTTSGGFSGAGTCTRTSTYFTQFNMNSYSGGTPLATTFYGVHTGDVLITPPTLNTESEPIFTVAPVCPTTSKSLNYAFVQWGGGNHPLPNNLVLGTASYSVAGGLAVTGRYDVTGALVNANTIPLPGTCSNGLYTINGAGDQGGTVYFTAAGTGDFKTNAGHAAFFFPQYSVNATSDLGTLTLHGMLFDSVTSADAKQITAAANFTVTNHYFTVTVYADPSAGTIDGSFSDTLDFTGGINNPQAGMMVGTVTRTGSGAGTGSVACIVQKDLNTKVVCSGQSPNNNAYPYTVVLVAEGATVLGQPTPLSNQYVELGLNSPGGVFVGAGGRTFVADTSNHRVLVYNTFPSANANNADFVLGQADPLSNAANRGGSASLGTMKSPGQVYSDGTRLFVSDAGNNRVLVWNTIPTASVAADFVLGQSSSSGVAATTTATGMNYPSQVYSTGSALYVADQGNNRVLYYSPMPTASGAAAIAAFGQSDVLTTSGTGITSTTLNSPSGVAGDGTNFYIADRTNNRVLMWTSLPSSGLTAPTYALGQPDFVSNGSNYGGSGGYPSAQGLSHPGALLTVGGKLFAIDQGNQRVLQWNSVPSAFAQGANTLLGWTAMNAQTWCGAVNAQHLCNSGGIGSDGTHFAIADTYWQRVMLYKSMPTAAGQNADIALGQANFTTTGSNGNVSATTLMGPNALTSNGTKLAVLDGKYIGRIVIWNSLPSISGQAPDVVVGPSDFVSTSLGLNASGFYYVQGGGVAMDNTHLVSAAGTGRVLLWKNIPTANGVPADFVLGQPTFGTNTTNFNGSTDAYGINSVTGVAVDNTHLLITDSQNNRVMVWNSFPTASFQPCDFVLGQPNSTGNAYGNGGPNMNEPTAVFSDGTHVFVADTTMNRVLIWNTFPTGDASHGNESPDLILGQTSNLGGSCNRGGSVAANTVCYPNGVYYDGTRFFVSDSGNQRILMWNGIPTANLQTADAVFGQANFTSSGANNGGLSATSLYLTNTVGMFSDGVRLFANDSGNSRVVILPIQ